MAGAMGHTGVSGVRAISGDPAFDSDSIASDENQKRCWVSYPGARLCLNPASPKDFVTEALAVDLPLNIGGFVGQGVVRLPGVLTVAVADREKGDGSVARTCRTTWFPYKLGFEAGYKGGVRVRGGDFFCQADSTMIRTLQITNSAPCWLVLGGRIATNEAVRWDAGQQLLVVKAEAYTYALAFRSLEGALVGVVPEVGAIRWSLRLPVKAGVSGFTVSLGFAAACEGDKAALSRALGALEGRSVETALAATKAVYDGLFRRVPAPGKWGVAGVTPQRHRQAYYAAWAFLCQNPMDRLPENPDYPYPVMTVGKASLWAEGEKTAPASCAWESLLSLQWFSLLDPGLAWTMYEGIMSRVDGEGMLGGESLPSRKAQTAWVLHQRQPDLGKLAAVYPAIKRYLMWRERNLRWIYQANNDPNERDMEFVVSWLFDVGYAIRISDALNLPEERAFWNTRRIGVMLNMRPWFFDDPKRLHQFCFVDTGKHRQGHRTTDVPEMVTTALCLTDLPPDMMDRVQRYFRDVYRPNRSLSGFGSSKNPDANLTAYGLIDRGLPEARPYMAALLRDAINAGDFAEVLLPGPKGDGVRPSVFSALTMIEFTWLLEGVRFDTGVPVEFQFPKMDGGDGLR